MASPRPALFVLCAVATLVAGDLEHNPHSGGFACAGFTCRGGGGFTSGIGGSRSRSFGRFGGSRLHGPSTNYGPPHGDTNGKLTDPYHDPYKHDDPYKSYHDPYKTQQGGYMQNPYKTHEDGYKQDSYKTNQDGYKQNSYKPHQEGYKQDAYKPHQDPYKQTHSSYEVDPYKKGSGSGYKNNPYKTHPTGYSHDPYKQTHSYYKENPYKKGSGSGYKDDSYKKPHGQGYGSFSFKNTQNRGFPIGGVPSGPSGGGGPFFGAGVGARSGPGDFGGLRGAPFGSSLVFAGSGPGPFFQGSFGGPKYPF